ncbi:MAG: enoyl-[acyl-carrier-protein] reductase FabK [Clostridiales bacterium]|jgi:enoyl-[acyl-carrier protein] reductase II|nr:enoyl-[acyl-carrier-protein] reductase FabK [Clostridiales bacterium]
MITTNLCQMLGIRYPVFQGGMAWAADANLAAAVSNAGGLGIIGAMSANAAWLKKEIAKLRELTDKPFAVNIMLMSPFADEVALTVIEENVPIVTTGAGNPAKYMPAWIKAGIKVIPVVPSVGVARYVEKRGATAVITEGGEAGGHIGDLTTMVLTPQVCDAVKIPVIAAGGIADGRGVAAAFMLGACGVQMGTRFLAATECTIHANYKKKVIDTNDIDTIATGRRLGHPVRSIKTTFSMSFAKMEYDATLTNAEVEAKGAGALRIAVQDGNDTLGCFMAGQCAALVKSEMPAAQIIEEVFSQAESLLSRACQWIN